MPFEYVLDLVIIILRSCSDGDLLLLACQINRDGNRKICTSKFLVCAKNITAIVAGKEVHLIMLSIVGSLGNSVNFLSKNSNFLFPLITGKAFLSFCLRKTPEKKLSVFSRYRKFLSTTYGASSS